jgi:hypothetical protein
MAKAIEVRVEGLNAVLRALNSFGKEANAELRDEAQRVADKIMVPHYKRAAEKIPTYGEFIANDIRSRRDRVPAVKIGMKTPKLSGGASPQMLRWPTDTGDRGNSPAPFTPTNWMLHAKGYIPEAMTAYGDAIDKVVKKWNRGI